MKNLFRKFHRSPSPSRDFLASDVPKRDWNIMLGGAAVLLFLIAATAIAFYWWVAQDSSVTTGAPKAQTLSADKINTLLSRYQALDQEHTTLLTTPPAFADPAVSQ